MSYAPLPPAPPNHLPEPPQFRRRTRYNKPKQFFSVWGLLLGLAVGVAAGVFYAWNLAPTQEFDTQPRQLRDEDKQLYSAAIILDYAQNGDLALAVERLIELYPDRDPIQAVAENACDLARSGYVSSSSGLRAVRSMKTFYQLQGRSGCADTLISDIAAENQVVEIVAPTPTLTPPPTKTPISGTSAPTATSAVIVVPTVAPTRDFAGRIDSTYCDVELSGLIEVYVLDFNGDGLPGERIRVLWDGGEDRFMSGLKPERGPMYADFAMETGRAYIVDMPGRSDPIASPMLAEPCTTESGQSSIKSYRVVFRQVG